MTLPPPWKYLTRQLPPDATTVWIARIGVPEPPFLATWYTANSGFEFTLSGLTLALPWLLVLKWRLQ